VKVAAIAKTQRDAKEAIPADLSDCSVSFKLYQAAPAAVA